VHYQHGVGKYEGMVKRTIGGVERDYLLLAYKGGDKLYVPSDQIDTVRHYVGGETPVLHRLGGADFAKSKAKVRSAVREIAQELVVLYQKRVHADGFAFGQDTPWQHEMEQSFPFVETPDQRVAIADVKAATYQGSCALITMATMSPVRMAPLGNVHLPVRQRKIGTSTTEAARTEAARGRITNRRPCPGAAAAARPERTTVSRPFGVRRKRANATCAGTRAPIPPLTLETPLSSDTRGLW